jgi:uncharacterized Fe-S center protein
MASKVYLIKSSIKDGDKQISEKARKLFKAGGFASCFKENDFTAVKVHVGEYGNNTYIRPACFKGLVEELQSLKAKPFITDATTLYLGHRHNAIDHSTLAAEHGFSCAQLGIPFIPADGLIGMSETKIKINGELNKEVFIASDIVDSQSILSIAHLTGHCVTCLGATIKTLGMGCAGKKGKMIQHAALTLSITKNCTLCGVCYKHCPAGAISLGKTKASINQSKCIRCAECLSVCRFKAIDCNWGEETEVLQKNIAEHALGALMGKENRAVFFNFILLVTDQCDCFGTPDKPIIVDDIGITASTDPVAVDKASLDLVEKKAGKKLQQLIKNEKLNPIYQIEHGERIGLGSTNYELVEIS